MGNITPPFNSSSNEEQDVAVFVLHHRADQRARKVESAVKDDIANVLPILVGQFAERHVWADRRVVPSISGEERFDPDPLL
jgi:hypothetical protein